MKNSLMVPAFATVLLAFFHLTLAEKDSGCLVELTEVASFQTQSCSEFDSMPSETNDGILLLVANLWDGVSPSMGARAQILEIKEEKVGGRLIVKDREQLFPTKGAQSIVAPPKHPDFRQMILVANYAGCGGKERDLHVQQSCLRTEVRSQNGYEYDYLSSMETYGAMKIRYLQAGGRTWFVVAENFLDQISLWLMDPNDHKITREKRFRMSGRNIVSGDLGAIDSGLFFAAASYYDQEDYNFNSLSEVFKIVNNTLSSVQTIETQGAYDVRFKQYKQHGFLFISCERTAENPKVSSLLYKYDKYTEKFVKIQEIPTNGARNAEIFIANDRLYLAIANYGDIREQKIEAKSVLYRLNEEKVQFEMVSQVDTVGAVHWEYFLMEGKNYLAVCNQGQLGAEKRPDSKIYRMDLQCSPKTEL